MADLAPFIGSVGGPALGALIVVIGIILNSQLTRSRDREQDLHKDAVHLRDEKSQRLRHDFEIVLIGEPADAEARQTPLQCLARVCVTSKLGR